MRKLILGIVAILALHIGFVAFFATLDTVETARTKKSLTTPIAIPAAIQTVSDDEIIIARGTVSETPSATPAAVKRSFPKPMTIAAAERRTPDTGSRIVKTFKPQPKRVIPAYQTAANTVERAEFPQKLTFASSDNKRPAYSAKTKTAGKRSFFAKVGSIAKKPYDALKAVASWLK